jgi:hypothetical protein
LKRVTRIAFIKHFCHAGRCVAFVLLVVTALRFAKREPTKAGLSWFVKGGKLFVGGSRLRMGRPVEGAPV